MKKLQTHQPLHEADRRIILSVITPAFNECKNLPLLYEKMVPSLDSMNKDWEWVIVDDHSHDETFTVVEKLTARDARIRGVRLARNVGSHAAISCGIHHASGRCAIVLSADLQDPPGIIADLVREWEGGYHVVWAARRERHQEKGINIWLSRMFFSFVMRKVAGIQEMPATGSDYFLIDRLVMDNFLQYHEINLNITALVTWMGFRQRIIYYDKQSRTHGRSGWTIGKKIKIVIDSIAAFSYAPVRWMSLCGFVVAFSGFLYAVVVVINKVFGNPQPGWTALMVVFLVISGFMMIMMGILGEYLWRALEESRRRPRYLIEADTKMSAAQRDSAKSVKQ